MLKYSFFKDKILDEKGQEIMMDWETPLMKKHAEVVTENGGDILEIGFGMVLCLILGMIVIYYHYQK